jgi:hypothetical protein
MWPTFGVEIKNEWMCTSTPPSPSWHAQEQRQLCSILGFARPSCAELVEARTERAVRVYYVTSDPRTVFRTRLNAASSA